MVARDAAAIEAVLAAVADGLERAGQGGLPEERCRRRAASPPGRKIARRLRILREALGFAPRSTAAMFSVIDEPVACEAHGGLDDASSTEVARPGGARARGRRPSPARPRRAGPSVGGGRRLRRPCADAMKRSRRAARGAVSRKSIASGRCPCASREIQNPPPPMLPASGHVTARAKATATAASAALPPCSRISMPTRAAFSSAAATAPPVPSAACGAGADGTDARAPPGARERARERARGGPGASFHCAILPAR